MKLKKILIEMGMPNKMVRYKSTDLIKVVEVFGTKSSTSNLEEEMRYSKLFYKVLRTSYKYGSKSNPSTGYMVRGYISKTDFSNLTSTEKQQIDKFSNFK